MATAGLAAFAAMQATGLISELWRPLLWGFPALLVVAGAMTIEARGAMPCLRAMRSLGDASYSIYLWHLPAIAVIAHTLGTGRPWLFAATACVAAVAAGLAGREFIEKPLIALFRGHPIGPFYQGHLFNRLDEARTRA
jgi:exopolysaccharide production protein ExoZ